MIAPPPTEIDSIQFVGIWDTVDAYGGPIEEMTRAIDYGSGRYRCRIDS